MTATKVMIVEDEGVVAMHLSSTLRKWGYQVTSISATAEAAIESALENPPELVLMDIGLKGEMDGIQAALAIRENHDVPVIYLTAYRDEETLARAKTTEPYGYALKPFDENELKITIEMALYRHRADLALRQRQKWLDATLSSVGEAMIATDAEGRVRFMNDQAETLTGWRRVDAFSADISKVLREPAAEEPVPGEHFVKRVLRKHSVVSRGPGAELLTLGGHRVPIEDCAAPIRNSDGQVTGAVVIFRDATERRREEARLVHMAHHDALTGLPNRLLFQERLRQATARARRNRKLVAVLLLDLDNFKMVNDSLGHSAGDELLVAAAGRVLACVRETDTVARLGGDEIAVIQSELDDETGATTLADKLVRAFGNPFSIDGKEINTTISVGITVITPDEEDHEEILRRADTSMYRAKAAGRNRYDDSNETGSDSDHLPRISEEELRRAIERSELEVYLQPIFDLTTGDLAGAEALVRWNHPERGLVSASRFIQAAERFGVIGPIVDLTLRKACSAATSCLRVRPDMRISVNLSESDLRRRDLVNVVSSVLDGSSLAPEHLGVEVTERSSVEPNRSVTAGNLQQLRDLGIPISLDGFGREVGSMLKMTAKPVRTVKIDRSLVKGIPNDSRAVEIVRATVNISKAFNVTVVAVGVETEEQMQSLRDAGCHQVQGNLLGSPVSTSDFFVKHVM